MFANVFSTNLIVRHEPDKIDLLEQLLAQNRKPLFLKAAPAWEALHKDKRSLYRRAANFSETCNDCVAAMDPELPTTITQRCVTTHGVFAPQMFTDFMQRYICGRDEFADDTVPRRWQQQFHRSRNDYLAAPYAGLYSTRIAQQLKQRLDTMFYRVFEGYLFELIMQSMSDYAYEQIVEHSKPCVLIQDEDRSRDIEVVDVRHVNLLLRAMIISLANAGVVCLIERLRRRKWRRRVFDRVKFIKGKQRKPVITHTN